MAKSSATGKLTKVYDKAGHKYGVIEITMDLALTKVGDEGQQIELKPGSKVRATAVLDGCIDGSKADVTGKMTVKGNFTGSTMGVDLKFELASDKDGKAEELDKK